MRAFRADRLPCPSRTAAPALLSMNEGAAAGLPYPLGGNASSSAGMMTAMRVSPTHAWLRSNRGLNDPCRDVLAGGLQPNGARAIFFRPL